MIKKPLYILLLFLISLDLIAGESMGCILAKAKLQTSIEMQKDYEEKQRYYRQENGGTSVNYEIGLKISQEDEREARAEVNRKCN